MKKGDHIRVKDGTEDPDFKGKDLSGYTGSGYQGTAYIFFLKNS
jgi:hypothetical protein